MAEIIPLDRLRIAGRWIDVDKLSLTSLVFEISIDNGHYGVRLIDPSDGEEAEIYDLKEADNGLTFAAHWETGRFTKYRLRVFGDQIDVTYTYNDHVLLIRETQ